MATLADLDRAIDQLLSHPAGGRRYQLTKSSEPKAYEAYVYGLCLRAAREAGATPVLRGIMGPPDPFVFRGGPGQIHSTGSNFGYSTFVLGSQEFEVHAGIEYRGTSGMTHELDLSVLRARDADNSRALRVDPSSASLVAGWECKFYGGTLEKTHGRALVGLLDDMGRNVRIAGLCSNSMHPQLFLYLQPYRRPFAHFRLSPLSPSRENQFVGLVAAGLAKSAGA